MKKDEVLDEVIQGQSNKLAELNLRGRLKGNQEFLVKHQAEKVLPEPINIFYWTQKKTKEEKFMDTMRRH